MKVLNLRCAQDHGFEGWFASEDDFQDQCRRQLVSCPMCGDPQISKLPSAPRLNLSGARAPAHDPAVAPAQAQAPAPAQYNAAADAQPPGTAVAPLTSTTVAGPMPEALQAMHALHALWLKTVHRVMANTEDVGQRFPEEARRMHYGEAEHRGIRGVASAQEREALAEEGIEVMPLPLPPGLKGPVQ